MDKTGKEQESIREYLLGQLSSEDREQFEQQLLIDGELYEELVILEDELVDEYLREELSTSDRQSFESFFLASPEHREKLNFARAFTKYLGVQGTSQAQEMPTVSSADARTASVNSREMRPPAEGSRKRSSFFGFLGIQNPTLGYAMSAAVVLLLVGITWVAWKNFSPSGPTDPGRVFSFVLTPGVTRDVRDGGNRITVPANTDTLRLQLLIPESSYQSYEATLIGSDGGTLTTLANLKPESLKEQQAVAFDVPTNLVPPGDYRVKLNGVTSDGSVDNVASFSFRTAK